MRRAVTIVIALALSLPATVESTTLLLVDLERMSQEATLVVLGHVAWDAAVEKGQVGDIYSYTGIEVTRCVAGDCPKTLVLKHRGGTVGDLTLVIPGMPGFETGQEVLLFLRPEPEGETDRYSVFGMAQGHFLVTEDPDTTIKTATQMIEGVSFATIGTQGGIVLEKSPGPIVMELESLTAKIRKLRTGLPQGGAK